MSDAPKVRVRVMVGNEAGRFVAGLIRGLLADLPPDKPIKVETIRAVFSQWADELETASATSDEELAVQEGRKQGAAAQYAAMVAAVEGVARHDWTGGTLIDRNEVLAALALHDPNRTPEGRGNE